MKDQNHSNPRDEIKLIEGDKLYEIRDEQGQIIDFDKANGKELFNHYRHNMTNYDDVLDRTRQEQGYVSGRQEKQAAIGSAEKVIELYRDEHIKVIQDAQKKNSILKTIFTKAKVGTASALVKFLDDCSEKIKTIGNLESSQRTLQVWNDTYRVQRELVKKILIEEEVSPETINKINAIYSTRSANKAIEKGSEFLNLEKSEILKIVKSAIKYSKLLQDEQQ